MDAPLAPALPPLVRGRMRFIRITGIPDSWFMQRPRNQDAIVAGRSPWIVCVFGPYTVTLFRSEFWNNILTIFPLVISFTGW